MAKKVDSNTNDFVPIDKIVPKLTKLLNKYVSKGLTEQEIQEYISLMTDFTYSYYGGFSFGKERPPVEVEELKMNINGQYKPFSNEVELNKLRIKKIANKPAGKETQIQENGLDGLAAITSTVSHELQHFRQHGLEEIIDKLPEDKKQKFLIKYKDMLQSEKDNNENFIKGNDKRYLEAIYKTVLPEADTSTFTAEYWGDLEYSAYLNLAIEREAREQGNKIASTALMFCRFSGKADAETIQWLDKNMNILNQRVNDSQYNKENLSVYNDFKEKFAQKANDEGLIDLMAQSLDAENRPIDKMSPANRNILVSKKLSIKGNHQFFRQETGEEVYKESHNKFLADVAQVLGVPKEQLTDYNKGTLEKMLNEYNKYPDDDITLCRDTVIDDLATTAFGIDVATLSEEVKNKLIETVLASKDFKNTDAIQHVLEEGTIDARVDAVQHAVYCDVMRLTLEQAPYETKVQFLKNAMFHGLTDFGNVCIEEILKDPKHLENKDALGAELSGVLSACSIRPEQSENDKYKLVQGSYSLDFSKILSKEQCSEVISSLDSNQKNRFASIFATKNGTIEEQNFRPSERDIILTELKAKGLNSFDGAMKADELVPQKTKEMYGTRQLIKDLQATGQEQDAQKAQELGNELYAEEIAQANENAENEVEINGEKHIFKNNLIWFKEKEKEIVAEAKQKANAQAVEVGVQQ